MNADEKKIRLQELANKWLIGTLTDVEQLEFDSWFVHSDAKPLEVPSDVAENKEQYRQLIFSRIKKEIGTEVQVKTYRLWPRIAIAAAVATIIFSAGIWFLKRGDAVPPTEIVATNDVAPGKVGATLTLASGKAIRLSDAANGELANEAGVMVTKSTDGQLVYEMKSDPSKVGMTNTLSTAKGETYQVRLPDGSVVWLNSASTLTYSAQLLEGGKRVVKLKGEGFFAVAKDAAHPFVVQTGAQNVEVLGTQFNVNSYQDEPAITTTLVEGSVKVNSQGKEKVIVPGQQVINKDNALRVAPADIQTITDWKSGEFNLDGLDMRTAMRKIARWYDVEVIYDQSVPNTINAGGWISRDTPLSAILKVIERSGLVSFKVEGRRVYVSR